MVLALLHGPIPTTTSLEMRLPKAQAMAAPTRPPPDTTTSYTVSAGAPAHLRQETSGPFRAAIGAAPHLLKASRAAIVTTYNRTWHAARSTLGSTSGAEPYYLSPQPLGL